MSNEADLVEQAMAMVALCASLLLFLLSTRQHALSTRAPIWFGGAILLGVAAIIISGREGQFSLARAVVEAVTRPGDSVLGRALAGNTAMLGDSLIPMLNVFLLFGFLLGLAALVAFTPGEGVERAVRPLAIGLIGAVVGGFAALAVVAVGFGGHAKREVFFGVLRAQDIHDGDTIQMGDVSLRLAGIDAPEFSQDTEDARSQFCIVGNAISQCGRAARDALVELAKDQLVVCERVGRSEPYGRVPARCEAKGDAGKVDLAREIVRRGLAISAEQTGEDTDYSSAADAARLSRLGLWATCALRPDAWRSRNSRAAFEQRRFRDVRADLVDETKCPMPPLRDRRGRIIEAPPPPPLFPDSL